ncbi:MULTISPECIES: hypothetical protein [unclassified Paenibacillus]|uniref:hypothetical protein n=1 Tax=unclassified Paenibacillus TaxID=185978 RepID=UPI002404E8E6|nr:MULTISPECIES: hypothetical protein [unclassified Paenibacillus]MDF9845017.1 class 3 adenylate cyclase [Paenibacillus sp. PastF-2]MDF9851616.1 class 3 adenylate cyclase [Paenibacillus sp. PastM-2]MDF9858200.1 class 3 adenylate cyclase [Paenibacillus sp. PastF-1]MDH6483453.1 class 3 adenylate cyclase [Paenibacillus sp. PastH-2]MDH6510865.1 class 3 adenylate cyclase [Paenibacillus sp. PastM-3]
MKSYSYKSVQDLINSLNAGQLLEHLSISDLPNGIEGNYVNLSAATMVFDLAGSSLSIRERGAKDYFVRHQNIFRNLTQIIYAHKGIIEKFPGDGISMHFVNTTLDKLGIVNCITHAVRTANEIINYLITNEGMTSGFRLSLSYGDDTIAALIGGKEHEEWITIGHAVNVAHKLEKEIKDKHCIFGMDEDCYSVYTNIYRNGSAYRFAMPEDLKKQIKSEEFWYGVK